MLLIWLIPVWTSVIKHTVVILDNPVAFRAAVAFVFAFANQGISHPRSGAIAIAIVVLIVIAIAQDFFP